MFKTVGSMCAVNAEAGVSLQITGLHSLLYQQGDRSLSLDSERLMEPDGQYKILVYFSGVTEWTSPEHEQLSEHERRIISQNLFGASIALGIEISIE